MLAKAIATSGSARRQRGRGRTPPVRSSTQHAMFGTWAGGGQSTRQRHALGAGVLSRRADRSRCASSASRWTWVSIVMSLARRVALSLTPCPGVSCTSRQRLIVTPLFPGRSSFWASTTAAAPAAPARHRGRHALARADSRAWRSTRRPHGLVSQNVGSCPLTRHRATDGTAGFEVGKDEGCDVVAVGLTS